MKSVKALSSASLIALGLWIAAPLPALAQKPTATARDGSVLPFPPKPSTSDCRTYAPGIEARAVSGRKPPAEGRAQYPDHSARRRRLRLAGYVRRPGPYADASRGSPRKASATTASTPRRSARRRARRLLTGRNHQRVGSGTIAERAVNWDGYTGVIPRTSATHRQGARQLRLQHRSLRQMAQHARHPNHRDGPVHAVADRRGHRLRLFLRLPCRRDLAMGAAADRELQSGRAAA